MESAMRHGVATVVSILTALTGLVGIIIGWLADTPAPAGISVEDWQGIGELGVKALVILKGAQAVATIIGQYLPQLFGNQPEGADEMDAGPPLEALPEG